MYAAVRAGTAPGSRWDGVAIGACLLGTLCKETIVVTPVLVALFDRLFLVGSWRQAYRERGSLYLGLAASWFVLASLLWSGPRSAVGGFSAGVDVWTYLLNQAVMIVEYLRKTIWPVRLVVFYGWPLPLTLSQVWPQATVVVTLLVATGVACVKTPRLGYLGAWFFITLAPTSSIVPIVTEVGAERRMYLPLMALATLAVIAAWSVPGRSPRAEDGDRRAAWRGWTLGGLTLAVAGALAAATVARNREYATPLTLAQTIVDRRPSGVAHHMLGEQLGIANRIEEAIGHLQQAVAHGNTRARFQLGVLLVQRSDLSGATRQFEEVVRLGGVRHERRWLEPPLIDVLQSRLYLGQIYANGRRWVEAEAQAREVLARVPAHVDARRVLAAALVGQQRWAESITEHRQYLEARPGDAQARVNLGVALIATGQMDAAIAEFQRAVEVDPSNPNARRLLEMARQDRARVTGVPPQ
jgi:tetratricopeptide (TPR) repeat protein